MLASSDTSYSGMDECQLHRRTVCMQILMYLIVLQR